jgi:hypothetical protein
MLKVPPAPVRTLDHGRLLVSVPEDDGDVGQGLSGSRPHLSANSVRQRHVFPADLESQVQQMSVRLIRLRGHLPKGGYDVPNAERDEKPATAPAV